MQLRQRIWILPIFSLVIIIVFMIGMGVVYYYNRSALEKFENIKSVYVPVKNSLAQVRNHILHIQSIFEEVVITQDMEAMLSTSHHSMEVGENLHVIEQALPKIPGVMDLQGFYKKYYDNAVKLSERLLTSPMSELSKEINDVKFYREHLDEHLLALEDYLEKEFQQNATDAQDQMQQLTGILFAMIFVLVSVLTVGSFVIMRSLSRRLSVLADFARQVQGGNYDKTVEVNWNDEFAVVVNAFNSMLSSIKESTETLNHLANYDGLTKIYNRTALIKQLETEVRASTRHNYPLSFCMCDIDKFKVVNDTYGHEAGDMVLNEFSSCLQKVLRMEDIVGRYGGDEFCIVFPHTQARQAAIGLERIQKSFQDRKFIFNGNEFSVTCSFGIADYQLGMDKKDLMRLADEALYESKEKGRNCVTIKESKASG